MIALRGDDLASFVTVARDVIRSNVTNKSHLGVIKLIVDLLKHCLARLCLFDQMLSVLCLLSN